MKAFLLFLLSTALLIPALASEKIQIQSMREVEQKVAELRRTHSAAEILLVFDIDNTLLTTEVDLGGDAWFLWQEEKLKNKETTDLVAPDFEGLLRVQGYLYSIGQMQAPEMITPGLFKNFQQQGHPVFLLTSRGLDFQNYTQRELWRNSYDASLTAPGPRGGFASRFLPYDLKNPAASCLQADEVQAWGLPPAKPVVFEDGVFYGSGQHKGAMLRSLLCKTQANYPVIVFVDDMEKHVDRVLTAYEKYNTKVISMRYGAVDPQVQRFKNSDKREVTKAWLTLKQAFESVFGRPF